MCQLRLLHGVELALRRPNSFSTGVDFLIGRYMGRSTSEAVRKALVTISVTLNLGLLAFFKYHNFFVDTTGVLLEATGIPLDPAPLRHSFLLPVGISFYTFQSLSYTIDLYRGSLGVERKFTKFALYVAFFPQLVAGPIVRAADFLPQLNREPQGSRSDLLQGTALIFRGLIKKVFLADLLASLGVDTVFADPSAYSSITLMLALYGYSFQIYNDFSGYSDIAIGAARVLGFQLPENFNRPYLAQNVREFWTRWHISLSSWLRDYLYIPLGGNRGTTWQVRRNLMVTMILGGLWHGAALNFVLWGLWHGALLVLARGIPKHYENTSPLRVFFRRFLCFHLIVVSWLLFRVGSYQQLHDYLAGMGRLTGELQLSGMFLGVLATAACAHFFPKKYLDDAQVAFTRLAMPIQAVCYTVLIVLLAGASLDAPSFIYFQF